MKKYIYTMLSVMMFSNIITAQNTPKWADKAKKAVFSVVTYDKENKIMNTGNGFFIDGNGVAISDFTLFNKAHRAVAITEAGKELPIETIMGANSMYDVIKFNTQVDKKAGTLKIASSPAKVGDKVYLLPYSTKKIDTCAVGKILSVDSIGDKNFYYSVDIKTNPKLVSCPLMNENGEVIGEIQKNASYNDKESYAIGVGFGNSLSINALSGNDEALNSIDIKKAFPESEDQALIYLMMLSSRLDAETYLTYLNDFISKYPNNGEGYQRRAAYYLSRYSDENNKNINEDIKKSLNLGKDKAANKAAISKLIYSYNIQKPDTLKNEWNLDKALEYIKEAIKDNEQPLYVQQEGDIYFAMRKYQDAFERYDKVNKTNLVSSSSLYSAAKAKELIEGSDKNEVLALLDSAVVRFTKPYTTEAAPYIYERATIKADLKKYKEAVEDYNTFYDIVNGDVTANFYLQRQQSEVNCKMFQQAIDDINYATDLAPKDPVVWVEKGSTHIRVGQLDEAASALRKAIALDSTFGEAYRMLGYCQARQNKKKEALENLNKAKELGDVVADSIIAKYCK